MTQLAYFGKKKLKKKIVKRALSHQNAGRIEQRTYGKWHVIKPGTAEFRGCSLACFLQPTKWAIIENGFLQDYEAEEWAKLNNIPNPGNAVVEPHRKIEEKLNFSQELALVIECIFETLDPEDAKYWPYEIADAVSIKADVSAEKVENFILRNHEVEKVVSVALDMIGCPDRFEAFREHLGNYDEWQIDPKYAGQLLIDFVS